MDQTIKLLTYLMVAEQDQCCLTLVKSTPEEIQSIRNSPDGVNLPVLIQELSTLLDQHIRLKRKVRIALRALEIAALIYPPERHPVNKKRIAYFKRYYLKLALRDELKNGEIMRQLEAANNQLTFDIFSQRGPHVFH